MTRKYFELKNSINFTNYQSKEDIQNYFHFFAAAALPLALLDLDFFSTGFLATVVFWIFLVVYDATGF